MLLLPRRRTLSSFVVRAIVPRVVLFAVGALILGLGQAMAVNTSASAVADSGQVALPTWTQADRSAHPECRPSAAEPGVVADYVVVHSFREGEDRKMAFDEAWRLNHDETEADDVWVLGVCD